LWKKITVQRNDITETDEEGHENALSFVWVVE
jgi:hypothetical protein